jgi:hypothetical protein
VLLAVSLCVLLAVSLRVLLAVSLRVLLAVSLCVLLAVSLCVLFPTFTIHSSCTASLMKKEHYDLFETSETTPDRTPHTRTESSAPPL